MKYLHILLPKKNKNNLYIDTGFIYNNEKKNKGAFWLSLMFQDFIFTFGPNCLNVGLLRLVF